MQVSSMNNRLGFHYYPDSIHYRQEDLNTFLPLLVELGAGWITLISHPERAIPESFIQALLKNAITPIIHIPIPVQPIIDFENLEILSQVYANWGIKYLVLFDRPNLQVSWNSSTWSQKDLVERFLDCFLPATEVLLQQGLCPVFPPLEPGGDYWDTVFLNSALRSIIRRGHRRLLDSMVLSAYAWTNNHDLNWGRGGPDKWPSTFPYHTPSESQDQCGFRIFDWYLSISQTILMKKLPILLLASGCRSITGTENFPGRNGDKNKKEQTNLDLFDLIKKSHDTDGLLPTEVIACNIWLLAASEEQPESVDAWIAENRAQNHMIDLVAKHQKLDLFPGTQKKNVNVSENNEKKNILGHYILFPENSWEKRDWLYDIAQTLTGSQFVKFGSSTFDALQARRVTILGENRWLDETFFSTLSSLGCVIEENYGDGTLIASKIKEFVNFSEVPK